MVDKASGLWLNTTSDLKVIAMMKSRPVHLIQQYSNGGALVTVFTSKCESPITQRYTLGDMPKFKDLGGDDAMIILHNGTPNGQEGVGDHFNAVLPP